jgi:hypothetical protein
VNEEIEDVPFKALSYGLTVKQYKDAVVISHHRGDITRATRCLALFLKYPPDQVQDIARCVVRLREDRD